MCYNNNHYIVLKAGPDIFLNFDNFYIKHESISLFNYDQFHFELNGKLISIIDVDIVESIYHYNDLDDIVKNNRTYDYNHKPLIDNDVLPFPEVEYRFKVFSDCFETEFKKYSEALEFARFNACAVFDCESCKIIDDFREENE